MAGTHKGHLGIGIILAISFWIILFLIFSPIFGHGRNGLQYADEMFNNLAKGSSYFIPKVAKTNEKFMGKMFSITIKMDKPEDKPGDAEKELKMQQNYLYLNLELKPKQMDLNLK